MTEHFNERVRARQQKLGHALCVGFDPDPNQTPDKYHQLHSDLDQAVLHWMKDVSDQTAEYTTVRKPQVAYYEGAAHRGFRLLPQLIDHMRTMQPEIPILLDCKRGEIDRSQDQNRKAVFDVLGVDAANVTPYMGREPVANMHDSDHPERGIISLVYTSNPGGRQVQDVIMIHPDTGEQMPYWRFIAECAIGWAEEVGISNLGFVMAAAHEKDGRVYSDHLRICRELDQGYVPYLQPGFGTQGGYVEASIDAGWAGWGSLFMNSSSGISNAESPREAARALSEQIGEAIAKKPASV